MLLIFSEEFQDNKNQWWEEETVDFMTKVEKDRYIFEHRRTSGFWYVWKQLKFDESYGFLIQTKIQRIMGVDQSSIGFVWGGKDVKNLYFFRISGDGHFQIGEINEGAWIYYTDWIKSNSINLSNSTNSLAINKSGQNLDFLVNNTSVHKLVWNKKFFGDNLGFQVGHTMKIAIHNISVITLSKPRSSKYDFDYDTDNEVDDGSEKDWYVLSNGKITTDPEKWIEDYPDRDDADYWITHDE